VKKACKLGIHKTCCRAREGKQLVLSCIWREGRMEPQNVERNKIYGEQSISVTVVLNPS